MFSPRVCVGSTGLCCDIPPQKRWIGMINRRGFFSCCVGCVVFDVVMAERKSKKKEENLEKRENRVETITLGLAERICTSNSHLVQCLASWAFFSLKVYL